MMLRILDRKNVLGFVQRSKKMFTDVPFRRLSDTLDKQSEQSQTVERAQWFIHPKVPGKQNWLLKILGYYSEESGEIRNSVMIYLNARDQSTKPEFMRSFGVGDDTLSKFNLEGLHVWMVLVRLRREGKRGKRMSQELFDRFWEDATKQLHSMGVKPISLNTRLRELQNAFYGSAVSYDYSLGTSDALLASALHRNLFQQRARSATQLFQMVGYVRAELHRLESLPSEDFLAGRWRFAPPLAAAAAAAPAAHADADGPAAPA